MAPPETPRSASASPSASGGGGGGGDHETNPLQGYFEWQVTTFMLAYDLVDPIHDEEAANARRRRIELEVGELVRSILPEEVLVNPEAHWDRTVMETITRATLRRAVEIAGLA